MDDLKIDAINVSIIVYFDSLTLYCAIVLCSCYRFYFLIALFSYSAFKDASVF